MTPDEKAKEILGILSDKGDALSYGEAISLIANAICEAVAAERGRQAREATAKRVAAHQRGQAKR